VPGDRVQFPQPLDLTVWLGADPALALVTADLPAWLAAHPCDCEASCDCDDDA
jgi:hypothetical protein